MATRTAAHLELARRLLEASESDASSGDAAAVLYATLAGRLAPLIGRAGFRAIFGRSLKVTKADSPGLEAVLAKIEVPYDTPECHDQVLEGLRTLGSPGATDVGTGLYGTLLAQLGGLVGERLVGQVLQRAFPALAQNTFKETK